MDIDRKGLSYINMLLPLIFLFGYFDDVKAQRDSSFGPCLGLEVVRRQEWLARNAVRQWPMKLPLSHVIILHTVTDFCKTNTQCERNVRFVQDFHLDERGWWDIAYNFLVGGDGRIYEGRGWRHTGAHSVNFNTNSISIAFIGNFNEDYPTKPMIDATVRFIECAVELGYLTPTREIHGHRDVACTESPGDHLYAEIRKWDNYKGGRLDPFYCKPLVGPEINKDVIGENRTRDAS